MTPPLVVLTATFRNGTTLRITRRCVSVSATDKWEAIGILESRAETWSRDGYLKHWPEDKPHEHITYYPWNAVESISIDVEPATPNEHGPEAPPAA